MKRTWMTLVFAAAATCSAALAGELNANIPFDFTAGGKAMASGAYVVTRLDSAGGSYVIKMTNRQTGNSAMLVSTFALNSVADDNAKLIFRCASGPCALAQVHSPGESQGRAFAMPRTLAGDRERTVAVRLTSATPGRGF